MSDRLAWTWLVFIAAFLVYNTNGREIQSYDSQPTKYAARELALHGRLTLDAVVASAPPLAERSAFQRDRSGRYRSAYSVVPSIEAAGWEPVQSAGPWTERRFVWRQEGEPPTELEPSRKILD